MTQSNEGLIHHDQAIIKVKPLRKVARVTRKRLTTCKTPCKVAPRLLLKHPSPKAFKHTTTLHNDIPQKASTSTIISFLHYKWDYFSTSWGNPDKNYPYLHQNQLPTSGPAVYSNHLCIYFKYQCRPDDISSTMSNKWCTTWDFSTP
jgi:hypothetical protein